MLRRRVAFLAVESPPAARTGGAHAQALGCGPGTDRFVARVAFQQKSIRAIPSGWRNTWRDAGL
jgi:hypothetical protein